MKLQKENPLNQSMLKLMRGVGVAIARFRLYAAAKPDHLTGDLDVSHEEIDQKASRTERAAFYDAFGK